METKSRGQETLGRKSSEESDPPPQKRARVALACLRCKTRKQKCDGLHPACSTCKRLDVQCRYVAPKTPKPDERTLYIHALENRIANMETYMSSIGHDGFKEDHWEQTQYHLHQEQQIQEDHRNDEIDTLLGAVRDLSLSASGHYVGGTSTITLGRVLGSVVKSHRSFSDEFRNEDPNPRSISNVELAEIMGPSFVSPAVATRLLDGFIKHLSTRYPVLHTPRLKELHAKRDGILDVYEESILHLVYANAGRFLETTGETGNFFSDQHYEAALQHMDSVLELRDTRSVSYLVLMGIYCLRAPKDPGAWTLAGLAMRSCIELGLHRRSKHRQITMQGELRKRIFWSCYYLDREVSVALGRPPAISDNDIDVELPFDIGEEMDDIETIREASRRAPDILRMPPSSLTIFIHTVKLKQIESEIQHIVYRVDRPMAATDDTINGFLLQLRSWVQAIPPEHCTRKDTRCDPFDGVDVYMINYHKCVRLLLYPQLSSSPLNLEYLTICANACAGVCEAYKRLHHSMNAGYSPLSLQSVFLSGLTLIYCTWLATPEVLNLSSAINDCNIMLYVMTERWPAGRKYRDCFERIKSSIEDSATQSNVAKVRNLETATFSPALEHTGEHQEHEFLGGGEADFTQMIHDMTGEAFQWQNHGGVITAANPVNGISGLYQGSAGRGSTSEPRGDPFHQPDLSFTTDLEYYDGNDSGWAADIMEPIPGNQGKYWT